MQSDKGFQFVAHTRAAEHRLDLLMRSASGAGLESVASFMAAEIQRESKGSFLTHADPSTGHAWPERKHQYENPMLRKSGALWADVVGDYEMKTGGKANVFAHVPEGEASEDYATVHMFGSAEKNIKARRFAGLSKEGRRKVRQHATSQAGLLRR